MSISRKLRNQMHLSNYNDLAGEYESAGIDIGSFVYFSNNGPNMKATDEELFKENQEYQRAQRHSLIGPALSKDNTILPEGLGRLYNTGFYIHINTWPNGVELCKKNSITLKGALQMLSRARALGLPDYFEL